MWLYVPFGFYSVVQKPDRNDLCVRARVRQDLDVLRDKYLPELGPTKTTPAGEYSDYKHRAFVSHAAFGKALAKIAQDLHYGNVKGETGKVGGSDRAAVYYSVHHVTEKLKQIDQPAPETAAKPPAAKPPASPGPKAKKAQRREDYGGFVVDKDGRVLIVEPKHHYDGVTWTYPKGERRAGETPEQAALREVLERAGVEAKILGPVPGVFAGSVSDTRYFIMRPLRKGLPIVSSRTASVDWVTHDEAVERFKLNRKASAREIAMAVLNSGGERGNDVIEEPSRDDADDEDFPVYVHRIDWTLTGLAAGDGLGSTCEFTAREKIPALYEKLKHTGWPLKQIGGGPFNWRPGQGTDDTDMAWAIVESFLTQKKFDEVEIAKRFVAWMKGGAPDVGNTVRQVLNWIDAGAKPDDAGLKLFRQNPNAAANGSLMRNGVIPALADTLEEAFEYSIRQSVITHYHPLPVLCCCLHTWLIWQAFDNKHPAADFDDWVERWHTDWTEWVLRCRHPVVVRWLKEVQKDDSLNDAMEAITQADWLFDFDPFKVEIASCQGYCLLTLQIAVWAYCWTNIDTSGMDVEAPKQIPPEIRNAEVGSGLAWSVLVGHDSDTYGAVAGPLISAFMGGLPNGMTQGLEAPKRLRATFPGYEWDEEG